jgi:hypothetical protein
MLYETLAARGASQIHEANVFTTSKKQRAFPSRPLLSHHSAVIPVSLRVILAVGTT